MEEEKRDHHEDEGLIHSDHRLKIPEIPQIPLKLALGVERWLRVVFSAEDRSLLSSWAAHRLAFAPASWESDSFGLAHVI